ncbi:hypothetical protein BWI15_00735 [Kribbella sp. ALI-6-A]|uniref:hypothetical protein n=1 Tax=Kribbella sp. ALI-6-A TaxID=1933817 RepID=UPI00097BB11F|nr:hypothetical protein [Kribbella sp. ALI-6-A]ONI78435.1 hypothetical protein BWI15_00735 [Kribbella sp. ALI-6-A]
MNFPGKRVLLGSAVAVAALGVGGFAYAAGTEDPAPSQGYVTVEEDATTPSPGTSQGQAQQRDGRDCPEKDGNQGQAQPDQTQPEQSNPQGNA